MRFSFGLQTLLTWKRQLEDLSQERLAEKREELRAQEGAIESLKHERWSDDQRLKEEVSQGMDAGRYLLYKESEEKSYLDMLGKERERRGTMGEIEGEQQCLIDLMKERKILERVREKRLKQFIQNMEKMDQKRMDELMLRKYPKDRP